MTGFIFGLTLRQLLFRRSTLLLLALAALPVTIAAIYRLTSDRVEPEEFTVRVLCMLLVTTTVLPLTALLFGTSVIGDELEDGTVIYLLTKPLSRWRILLPKVAAAWLLTALFVFVTTALSAYIVLGGEAGEITFGFGIAAAVGALAYVTVFVTLSIVTSRALIAGLVFVFIWEGAVSGIFEGVRYLSIRHLTLGIADWLTDIPTGFFNAYVGGGTALTLCAIVITAALLYGNRRLQAVEIRDAT